MIPTAVPAFCIFPYIYRVVCHACKEKKNNKKSSKADARYFFKHHPPTMYIWSSEGNPSYVSLSLIGVVVSRWLVYCTISLSPTPHFPPATTESRLCATQKMWYLHTQIPLHLAIDWNCYNKTLFKNKSWPIQAQMPITHVLKNYLRSLSSSPWASR